MRKEGAAFLAPAESIAACAILYLSYLVMVVPVSNYLPGGTVGYPAPPD